MRKLSVFSLVLLGACSGDIYVRDGVTDGDTFFLAPAAHASTDPVLQSWVAYSLARSVCQLELGGDNPARQSSYACELKARGTLVDAWAEHRAEIPELEDDYLDSLSAVSDAGYLGEYTAEYFYRDGWQLPQMSDAQGFSSWKRQHLRGHRPQTRLVGYWGWQEKSARY